MKFNEQKAWEIIRKKSLSPTTLKIWRMRGSIPDIYFEKEERILLTGMVDQRKIGAAIEKFGKELQRLLETRKFKPGRKTGYYEKCLFSLCKEMKKYKETGKLS